MSDKQKGFNVSKTMYLIKVQQGVIGFADENGFGLGSFVVDAGTESRHDIEQRFASRFSAQRHNAKGKNQFVEGHWNFIWLDFDTVIQQKQPDLKLPEIKDNRKPKIYEITNQDNGFLVIKHDQELLDEDEVKIKLFEKSVNE